MSAIETLHQGRYLRLKAIDGWEFAERNNPGGAVIVVAVTDAGELLLVEQYRPPIGASTIEMPAGLVGDQHGQADESAVESARRELLEETGYEASHFEFLSVGPSSAGMSNEQVSFVRARGLKRAHAGGGVDGENITVHHVPLDRAAAFFETKRRAGYGIDPKLYAGLFFARFNADGSAA